MEISKALKRFRREFGLKQCEVTQALGVQQQSYKAYEDGRCNPSAKTLLKLANTYHVSTDYLLGLSNCPGQKSITEQGLISAIRTFCATVEPVLEGRIQDDK